MADKLTVGDYVTLVRGITYKGSLVGEPGPALLGLGSIVPGGGFREGDYKTYGGECPPKLMLVPGDLFASLKGATKDGKMIGSIARVPPSVPSGRLTQDTVKLEFRRKHKDSLNFIYWVLRTPHYRNYCAGRATGSAVVALSREDFLSYPVPAFTSARRRLVSVLEALDDKIDLNRRMNETLEASVRALFKSSFVAPTRDALPEGWSVRALYDCARYINGAAFRNEHFSSDRRGLPVIKIGELKDGITAQTKFCEVERESKYRIASGDILFSWSGSPDTSIGTFVWAGGDGWLNQHIFKIKFNRPLERFFVYYLLRHFNPEFIEIARNKQTTGLGHVTVQDLRRLKTPFPPDDVLIAFNRIAEPLFQKVYSDVCESRTLAELRDTLLPKLLSGQLQVTAEREAR